MKRILVCDNDIAQRKHLRAAIERFARDRQITNVVVAKALSPQAMLAELMRTRKSLFNMVICNAQGEGALDALKQLRRLDPNLRIALVSNQKADAVAAYEIGASLLLMPSNGQEFLKAVGEPLSDISVASEQPVEYALSRFWPDAGHALKQGPRHLPAEHGDVQIGVLHSQVMDDRHTHCDVA